MPKPSLKCLLGTSILALTSAPVVAGGGAGPVRVERLLTVGDALADSTVQTLNVVFTNGQGQPGSIVTLADNGRAIWYDGGVVFNSNKVADHTLTGGEPTIGIGDDGRFMYSPNTDGEDSVWTHNGVLMRGTDPAPGIIGQFTTFHSRPSMLPNGTAVWVAGFTAIKGGSTQGRALYWSNSDGVPAPEPILKTGDLVGGFTIATNGIGFQYKTSDNGKHVIGLLVLNTGSTANDDAAHINGEIVAREGDPVGASAPGENWQNFAGVSINDHGHWLLAGDTDGATASDAFVAYNGEIQMREGSSYGGEPLPSGSSLRAISINNAGQAAATWSTPGNVRKLFFANNAGRLHDAVPVLVTGDGLDFNGDDSADATLIDILGTFTTTNALQLAESGVIYLHVSYDENGDTRQSLIGVRYPDYLFADDFEGQL